ncbi:hypothetical protein ACA097_09530 [Pseudomonas sp. QL9]|uniref:phage tail tube protein n=1 Tax=Pseudomonas sp. QL9 TaxID=3242725 RepID=UPI00352AC57B
MILAPDRSLIGYGMIGMRAYQAQSGFLETGNSNELKIQHATEKKTLPNYRTGVGNNNSRTRVTGITGSFTLYDWTPSTLALALSSKVRGVAAGTVTDEVQPTAGTAGELIVFDDLPDVTQPVTIKTAGDVACAAGVDYLLTPYGIQVIGGGKIDDTGIKATYSKIKASAMEVLAGTSGFHSLHFAGLNDVQDGAVYDVTIWRAKFDVVQELPVSGTDYQPLAITFEALADFTRVASDLSQFYTIRQPDPV